MAKIMLNGRTYSDTNISGNMKYRYLTISPSSLKQDTTYKNYPYKYEIEWNGVRESDFVSASIETDSFETSYLAKSTLGMITLYLSDLPSSSFNMYVYVETTSDDPVIDRDYFTVVDGKLNVVYEKE